MKSESKIFFQLLDLSCIFVALAVSAWLMIPPELNLNIFVDYTGASTFTVLIFFISFYMLDCYSVGRESFKDSVLRVMVAVLVGIIAAGFTFYSFEHWRFPRTMFVVQMAINLTLSLGWRCVYYWFSRSYTALPENILFLGAGSAARARRLLAEYGPQDIIAGYVGENGAPAEEAGPWLGQAEKLLEVVEKHKITRVIVLDCFYLEADLAKALFTAKLHGLKVDDMRGLYERLASRVPIDFIEDQWLLLENGFNLNVNDSMRRIKRAFDVVFSLVLLSVTCPILLITALCVRLESRGPVIYKQKRVGLYGKEFTVYKIRSMRSDAENGVAVWASKNDPRITKVGSFIRKTRIDELPQLVNVLKGDMSVVGPRPERLDFVIELREKLPYYEVRHTVKPGITGWAQVCYPYGASIEDSRLKLEYDLFYIKHLSLLMEMTVIIKTIGVILFPKGAR